MNGAAFEAKQLPDLLPDALHMIFEQLNPLERQSIRAVCTKFRSSVDSFVIKELVVKPLRQGVKENWMEDEEPDVVRSHRWYRTAVFADQRNFFHRLPEGAHLATILRGIRFLCLALETRVADLVSFTHHLINLRHLELNYLLEIPDNDRHHLCLPHLEVLRVGSVQWSDESEEFRMIFDSPALTVLCLGKLHLQSEVPTSCFDSKRLMRSLIWPISNQISLIVCLLSGDGNATFYIRVSHPESVRSFEFKQDFEDAVYTYNQVETVICNDVKKLAKDLVEKRNNLGPAGPFPIIDRLLELNTLRELHLLAGEMARGEEYSIGNARISPNYKPKMDVVAGLMEIGFHIHQSPLAASRPNRKIYFLGVRIDPILNPNLRTHPDANAMGFAQLFSSPVMKLHYDHRKTESESYPACSLHLNDIFFNEILKGRPHLIFELLTFLHSKYPFISEVKIEVPYLIPKLLMELSRPGSVSERIDRLDKVIRGLSCPSVDLAPISAGLPSEPTARLTDHERLELVNQISDLINLPIVDLDLREFRALHPRLYALGECWVLKFLGNFTHLACLEFQNSGFSQFFYDGLVQLPGLTASLNKLVLFDEDWDLVKDLQFLFRFQRLHHFSSNLLTGALALRFICFKLNSPGLFHLETMPDEENVEHICNFEILKHRGPHRPTQYDLCIWDFDLGNRKDEGLIFVALEEQLMADPRFNLFRQP